MKKQIKINTNYWESLNLKEQQFFKENVYQYGITVCKKVIQLIRKYIPENWDDLLNASLLIKDQNVDSKYSWILLKDNKMIAVITNRDKLCRIHIKKNHKLVTVYSNY